MSRPLLEVAGLKKHFPVRSGLLLRQTGSVKAVDGVSFQVMPRESFALVGESGCGKTTLGRLLLALETPTEGTVRFDGKDIFSLPRAELRSLRKEMQMVFQDPSSALDPRMTVEDIVAEPLDIHRAYKTSAERRKRVEHLIDIVGLAKAHLTRHPHEFSGGQKQRVGIARALALNPKLIVGDEPISALDVSIQAQILNLLKDLQKEFHLTYVFISHDFSVVRHLCDRVAVMYLGRIVELGDSKTLFTDPQHPYTEALLSAVPIPNPDMERMRKRVLLTGDVPSPLDPPSGCRFHPRCRYAVPTCRTHDPALEATRKGGHLAACPPAPFHERPSVAALPETAGGRA